MGYITCITCSSAEFDIIENKIQNHLNVNIHGYNGSNYCNKYTEYDGLYMIPFKNQWLEIIKGSLNSDELNMITQVDSNDQNWFPTGSF